jgi:hypothetical protein
MGSRRKSRETAQRRRQRAQRNQRIFIGIIAIGVVAIVAFGIYSFIQNQDQPGDEFEDLGNNHLSAEPTEYIWNTRPPTSGPHNPSTARWGVYTEPVPDWTQVHNLEDGGVIVHYNCPDECPDVVAELRSIMEDIDDDFEQMILHPYENMDSRIALTAWTRMITMDDVDEAEVRDFIEAYRGEDHHRG